MTAGRRRDEQAVLLERHGLQVELFPLLRTTAEESSTGDSSGTRSLRTVTAAMELEPPAYLIANTGYGMRTWFGFAREWGLLEDLVRVLRGNTVIVARGAKALGELRKVGLDAAYRAPGETMAEVVAYLLRQDLAGARVALQLHGDPESGLEGISAAGATVVPVPVYRTEAAEEAAPGRLADAIRSGDVDAVTFTAAPQVRVLESRSRESRVWEGVLEAFNDRGVVAACIGEVCAGAAREAGIVSPLVPPHPRLASLAGALAARLGVR